MTPNTQNIVYAFHAASTEDKSQGITWYPQAMSLARELDPADPVRAAAVLAVLSPLKSWRINMRLARFAYGMYSMAPVGRPHPIASPDVLALSMPCFKRNAAKAFRILAGEPIEQNVKGDKVERFFSNITGDHKNVTVDRHAIDIACGKVLSDGERAKVIAGKNGYANVARKYVSAARILSRELGVYITPPQVQAVTWVYWRKNQAQAYHG